MNPDLAADLLADGVVTADEVAAQQARSVRTKRLARRWSLKVRRLQQRIRSRQQIAEWNRRGKWKPLIEIARAAKQEDALAGLERWKARHPGAAAKLEPADVLVDAMRGRFTTWTRIRINLEHVPADERPLQEPLDPDYDPWAAYRDQGESRPGA